MSFHLIHILEIEHKDKDGNIIWQDKMLPNIFHRQGERFLLSVAFDLASSIVVPSYYYLGLDNRMTLSDTDTLSSLSDEPNTNGYSRQTISSLNGFTVALDSDSGKYRATSNSISFSASGGNWGPVRNLFMTTTSGSSGHLISSVALRAARTVSDGETITMRMVTALGN